MTNAVTVTLTNVDDEDTKQAFEVKSNLDIDTGQASTSVIRASQKFYTMRNNLQDLPNEIIALQ
ncbi:hypothetical protein N7499_000178 [Penicillium canescens]|uniref:Uncharacterized protein n=1 Tax=Penicillium canescens TaxID=5083 RepID=A0AAD6IGE6_PENCN|nr:uncharacterized protein N7446_011620 [Penicillium canescens]KAJ6029037.1 hypothetical protein N7444_012024 [Penicillium canescens]KAJ6047469.1 hypothetical protein N7460_003616 [Penicillium canescens]KAJ6048937.1 hypothetical protein N7446_011620 [Penicillium canescens]KAJ6100548.1 hypothetical protein N7499_000178 [Penicillium canescens]KAJ6173011.1 hypothetical protein N7485_005823 [Penicillium canescens]